MRGDEISRIMSSISPKNCAFGTNDAVSGSADGSVRIDLRFESLLLMCSFGQKLCGVELLDEDDHEPLRECCRLPRRGQVGGGEEPSLGAGARWVVQYEAGIEPNRDSRFLSIVRVPQGLSLGASP